MSQSVARLKELLFDSEAQALVDLTRRIDEVATADVNAREEIKKEISGVLERAGTTERFTASVSEVINEALRRAEVTEHSDLSNTIAPMVVTTIKTELRNSQDEMVEALYPITGRLVKAYVASAIKDLTVEMNRRLEQNPLMLRLQSLTTGRSVAELALAGTQDFEIEELFLIRRGSGELIAHWPPLADSRREQMVSGVLAAINAVANEAFAADEASLRQIDMDQSTVYLRASPLYLLAAKCTGVAPKGIEQGLDDAFLDTVEKQHGADALPAGEAAAWHARLLDDLGNDLKASIETQKSEIRAPAGNPLKVLAAVVLVPLLLLIGWWWASEFANDRAQTTGERVVAATAQMQGYPARFHASRFGRNLTVSGLAPSASVKDKVLNRLTLVLPDTVIQDELNVVPGSDITIPDQTPAIDDLRRSVREAQGAAVFAAIRRSGERGVRRLAEAEGDLRQAAAASIDEARAAALARHAASVGVIAKEAQSMTAALAAQRPDEATLSRSAAAFQAVAARIDTEVAGVLKALGDTAQRTSSATAADDQDRGAAPDLAADAMASKAERLAAIASVAALTTKLAARPLPAPVEASPRDKLKDLATRSAVFFGNGMDYRDPTATARTLDTLVPYLKAAPVLVRVVGYTDIAGTSTNNSTLAAERAERVRQDLIARGASASRLTAVGRAEAKDLSMSQGPDSPNRRVEFEIGFDGEGGP